jgi:hypothetical protein
MEKRIRGEEAQTRALGEMQGDSLDYQFAELDRDDDIEGELAAIKARVSGDDSKSLGDGSGTAGSGAAISSGSDTTSADAAAQPAASDKPASEA